MILVPSNPPLTHSLPPRDEGIAQLVPGKNTISLLVYSSECARPEETLQNYVQSSVRSFQRRNGEGRV